jgi:molybdenum cofactor guanylyltransferase
LIRSAYILAGGRSTRFGDDKANTIVEDEPHIQRLVGFLNADGLVCTIVAQADQDFPQAKTRKIDDMFPAGGPLVGLMTALSDCIANQEQTCLVVTCDLFEWRLGWGDKLASVICPRSNGSIFSKTATAMLPGAEFRPFPGIYRASVLAVAQSIWNDGGKSLRELHRRLGDSIRPCYLQESELPESFNTRVELSEIIGKRLNK